MINHSKPDDADSADSGYTSEDEFASNSDATNQSADNAISDLSRSAASALGAQTAFHLDSIALAQLHEQVGKAAQLQPEVLVRMREIAESAARMAIPTEALRKMAAALSASARLSISTEALAGAAAAASRLALSSEALESMAGTAAAASRLAISSEALERMAAAAAAAGRINFSEDFLENFRVTTRLLGESVSVPALYSSDQLALRRSEEHEKPRVSRTAQAFFDEHAVDVTDVRSLLKALSVVQDKHHEHRLVWRGQQDTSWPVHSSLYRKLAASALPTEDRLITAELTGMQLARQWGESTGSALKFFADLQHYGAPTRLLDATLDPEIAAWFAIEESPMHDEKDGRMIAWGRTVRTTARKVSVPDDELSDRDAVPFWHTWTSDEERGRLGWGTGSRTWSWFPPALSDRMRAQRAGFLLEAGPLVTPTVAAVISDGLTQDWRVAEITRATSIVGIPSVHDARTKPNEAHLVPLFSFRIAASAKPAIREYLKSKGLFFSTVYPDHGGLVEYLKGPFGLDPR